MATWYDLMGIVQWLFWFSAVMLVFGCIAAVTASYGWKRAVVYIVAATVVAAVCSIHDVAWPGGCDPEEWPCNCSEYVLTKRKSGDRYEVEVQRLPLEYPTDLHLEVFSGCLRKILLDHARETGRHGLIVLVNEGWVPSLWREIDLATAHYLLTGRWEDFDGMADWLALTWDDEELDY